MMAAEEMAESDHELFIEMLVKLDGTHESVKAASKWCRANAVHHDVIVKTWFWALAKSRTMNRRLDLFHLASDILFTADSQSLPFFCSFLPIFVKAIPLVRGEEIKLSMSKLLSLWREKNIYNEAVMDELDKSLRNKNKVVDNDVFYYDQDSLITNSTRIYKLKPAVDFLRSEVDNSQTFDNIQVILGNIKDRRTCASLFRAVDNQKKRVKTLVDFLEEMVHLLKMTTGDLDMAANREQNGVETVKLKLMGYERFGQKVRSVQDTLISVHHVPPPVKTSPQRENELLFVRRPAPKNPEPPSANLFSPDQRVASNSVGWPTVHPPEVAPLIGSTTLLRELNYVEPNFMVAPPRGGFYNPAVNVINPLFAPQMPYTASAGSLVPARESYEPSVGSRTPLRDEGFTLPLETRRYSYPLGIGTPMHDAWATTGSSTPVADEIDVPIGSLTPRINSFEKPSGSLTPRNEDYDVPWGSESYSGPSSVPVTSDPRFRRSMPVYSMIGGYDPPSGASTSRHDPFPNVPAPNDLQIARRPALLPTPDSNEFTAVDRRRATTPARERAVTPGRDLSTAAGERGKTPGRDFPMQDRSRAMTPRRDRSISREERGRTPGREFPVEDRSRAMTPGQERAMTPGRDRAMTPGRDRHTGLEEDSSFFRADRGRTPGRDFPVQDRSRAMTPGGDSSFPREERGRTPGRDYPMQDRRRAMTPGRDQNTVQNEDQFFSRRDRGRTPGRDFSEGDRRRAMTPGRDRSLSRGERGSTPGRDFPMQGRSRAMTPVRDFPMQDRSRAMTPGRDFPMQDRSRAMTPGRERTMIPGRDNNIGPDGDPIFSRRDRGRTPGRDFQVQDRSRAMTPGRERAMTPGGDRGRTPGRDFPMQDRSRAMTPGGDCNFGPGASRGRTPGIDFPIHDRSRMMRRGRDRSHGPGGNRGRTPGRDVPMQDRSRAMTPGRDLSRGPGGNKGKTLIRNVPMQDRCRAMTPGRDPRMTPDSDLGIDCGKSPGRTFNAQDRSRATPGRDRNTGQSSDPIMACEGSPDSPEGKDIEKTPGRELPAQDRSQGISLDRNRGMTPGKNPGSSQDQGATSGLEIPEPDKGKEVTPGNNQAKTAGQGQEMSPEQNTDNADNLSTSSDGELPSSKESDSEKTPERELPAQDKRRVMTPEKINTAPTTEEDKLLQLDNKDSGTILRGKSTPADDISTAQKGEAQKCKQDIAPIKDSLPIKKGPVKASGENQGNTSKHEIVPETDTSTDAVKTLGGNQTSVQGKSYAEVPTKTAPASDCTKTFRRNPGSQTQRERTPGRDFKSNSGVRFAPNTKAYHDNSGRGRGKFIPRGKSIRPNLTRDRHAVKPKTFWKRVVPSPERLRDGQRVNQNEQQADTQARNSGQQAQYQRSGPKQGPYSGRHGNGQQGLDNPQFQKRGRTRIRQRRSMEASEADSSYTPWEPFEQRNSLPAIIDSAIHDKNQGESIFDKLRTTIFDRARSMTPSRGPSPSGSGSMSPRNDGPISPARDSSWGSFWGSGNSNRPVYQPKYTGLAANSSRPDSRIPPLMSNFPYKNDNRPQGASSFMSFTPSGYR